MATLVRIPLLTGAPAYDGKPIAAAILGELYPDTAGNAVPKGTLLHFPRSRVARQASRASLGPSK